MPLHIINSFNQDYFQLKRHSYVIGDALLEASCSFQSRSHTHANLELLYVAGGKGAVFLSGKKYSVTKGDLVIVNPGIEHHEAFDPFDCFGEAFRFFSCELKEVEVEPLPREILLPHGYTPVIQCGAQCGRFAFLFDQIHQQRMEAGLWYEQICNDFADEIVLLVLRILNSQDFICTRTYRISDMSRIIQYIDAHLCEKINVGSIAAALNMSRHTLFRIFQSYQNTAPSQYIRKRRLELAKTLMEKTDRTLQAIAEEVGFTSYPQFYKMFCDYYGLSPSAYLKEMALASELCVQNDKLLK